jgi:hypothetical protein
MRNLLARRADIRGRAGHRGRWLFGIPGGDPGRMRWRCVVPGGFGRSSRCQVVGVCCLDVHGGHV